MRVLRKRTVLGAVGSLALVAAIVPGMTTADPDLPNATPHRHFVVTPDGELHQVGPQVCDDPSLQAAFNQFHFNVHRGAPGLAPGKDNPVSITIQIPCAPV